MSSLGRGGVAWADRVVPLATLAVVFDVELLYLLIGHLLSFCIGAL